MEVQAPAPATPVTQPKKPILKLRRVSNAELRSHIHKAAKKEDVFAVALRVVFDSPVSAPALTSYKSVLKRLKKVK